MFLEWAPKSHGSTRLTWNEQCSVFQYLAQQIPTPNLTLPLLPLFQSISTQCRKLLGYNSDSLTSLSMLSDFSQKLQIPTTSREPF